MQVLLFDVNETLLDLAALDPHFTRVFGKAGVRAEWFSQVLRSALVATLTGDYHDFGQIARHALVMTAQRHSQTVGEDEIRAVLGSVRQLPPHPDVIPALERLRAAGVRMATLTNSPPPVLADQLRNAGLTDYFEQALSVHSTRRFKPAPEPYHHAAAQLGVPLGEICMVAAHDWDIAGAMSVGCQGAFVARAGMVIGPLQAAPTYQGADLGAIVDQVLAAK